MKQVLYILLFTFLTISGSNAQELTENSNYPFVAVHKAPLLPDCESKNDKSKDCFSNWIKELFAQNFDTNIVKQIDAPKGRLKIIVLFVLNRKGGLEAIRVRTPYDEIKKEAKRILAFIPSFTPAEYDGKPVRMEYMLPISIMKE